MNPSLAGEYTRSAVGWLRAPVLGFRHSLIRSLFVSAVVAVALTVGGCAGTIPLRKPDPAERAYPAVYAALLAKYVRPDGVAYGEWHGNKKDRARLARVLAFYSRTAPPKGPRLEALAWNLNAYNAWTFHHVLKNYPLRNSHVIDSPQFQRKTVFVAGKRMTLDRLKQKVIRPIFLEPRIHFALAGSSRGGPTLSPRPLSGETLEWELNHLASTFVNSSRGLQIGSDGIVYLSPIFMWYASDFGGEYGRIEFINRYRPVPLPKRVPVLFQSYDWTLDETAAVD